ncbi:hypothetical protein B9G55_05335 [Saccharibacillus sp. O16]|nr:hypothetical protein B9G55_05335 [Saccharibacillus sp. O16]
MIIRLERDSVCMGDDCTAPNAASLEIADAARLPELIGQIRKMYYLASIYGGKATWVLYQEQKPLAVVAQQWEEAKYLIDPGTRLFELFSGAASGDLRFAYRTQQDPDEVFRQLLVR